ncbi:putative N-acetyltransferase YvbK [Variibacter gotjawalensis]|uniref:Putative N-acetyltransferase YvbK n=1 Tax=Variibacter gotjawalensis TaxID=1333996 RepID=A0A0S3PPI0_9BRAD|nr:GNAT family N-acetyltransferase [Variibacter gotjawalensis]NIK47972.1 ribosomal protein S18 acetylase RimI-like enzyme [Variibacter gotjawalensis]RZS49849.1 acetyltransferase (GNAT) family protein [Variibacter gotjawalensis]BAT57678.1 putative N-acetyltransferase YvbK [Variibacter gotjawalensis]
MNLSSLRRADLRDLEAVRAFQHGAYARNRAIQNVEPLPLMVEYADIFRTHEVWLSEQGGALGGVLILEDRPEDLLVWSVATAETAKESGIGNQMMTAAEERAAELGKSVMRLYTGQKLTRNVAWYERRGYVIERIETMPDRNVVHMVKTLNK